MRALRALAVLSLAVPAPAALPAPAVRVAAIASEAGFPVDGSILSVEPIAVPKARRVSAAPEGLSRPLSLVSGSGFVNGSGSLFCSSFDGNAGSMTGTIFVSGTIPVSAPDGSRGDARVSGSVFLSGSCRNGQGSVSGSLNLSGNAALVRDGRVVGTVPVSGNAFISHYAFSTWVSLSPLVSVTGWSSY